MFEPGLLFFDSIWTRRSFDAPEVKLKLYMYLYNNNNNNNNNNDNNELYLKRITYLYLAYMPLFTYGSLFTNVEIKQPPHGKTNNLHRRKQRREADQHFVFATRIVQFLFYLNPKFQASSSFLCLYRPVCVGPLRKPHR